MLFPDQLRKTRYIIHLLQEYVRSGTGSENEVGTNLYGSSATLRAGRRAGAGRVGGGGETGLCRLLRIGAGRSGGGSRGRGGALGGGGAINGSSIAVLITLLLNGSDPNVVGAVVVAGQHVYIVLAQAGVVVGLTAVKLALNGGFASVQDAVCASVIGFVLRKMLCTSVPHSCSRKNSSRRWKWLTVRQQRQRKLQ